MTWLWFALGYVILLTVVTIALWADPEHDDEEFDDDWP
jgi:hypothetical protein